jgi:hypothetical protein
VQVQDDPLSVGQRSKRTEVAADRRLQRGQTIEQAGLSGIGTSR